MVRDEGFDKFIEECRKVSLADVKALEAALDQCAEFLPKSVRGDVLREKFMLLLKRGAELTRFEEQVEKEADHV